MAIDAPEAALTHPHINTFVIVSGDSDFTPLVVMLREHGRHTLSGAGCGAGFAKNWPGSIHICSARLPARQGKSQ